MHQQKLKDGKGVKLTEMKSVSVIAGSSQIRIAELKLAAEIAKHCPISSIDCIAETIKTTATCDKESCSNPLNKIQIHRTKATMLINNVTILLSKKS